MLYHTPKLAKLKKRPELSSLGLQLQAGTVRTDGKERSTTRNVAWSGYTPTRQPNTMYRYMVRIQQMLFLTDMHSCKRVRPNIVTLCTAKLHNAASNYQDVDSCIRL